MPDLLEVGRITKAHGLRGEVVVLLVSDRSERVASGSCLETEHGPLTVASSRPHQDRHIVAFEGISTREEAEVLRGRLLYGEPIEDSEELWVHQLIGCTVRTTDGVARGVVESVMANPAADLLVLDTDALVPVVFVTDGPSDGVVIVDTPAGLFDLVD